MNNFSIKVLHTQTGEILGKNEIGEIYIKGPTVMKEYFKNKEATAKAIDEDGWLRSNDIGFYDDDNDFFVLDRARDFIKCKGAEVIDFIFSTLELTKNSFGLHQESFYGT